MSVSKYSKQHRRFESLLSLPLRIIRYVASPITRIFGPTDDEYPATGIQPFEGELFDQKKARHESS